ncbi:hypothetical protein HPB50_001806 [Hyalomma asiaticum]|uniref:Uncharacterized protein n=1 Tax=Hyalomma asiaticum TaxID=266040 RepID=A0ACB7TAW4_HYAAI|nr:hypothetical protein HPB50_001806 [Hyalomma asiaticum]
MGTLNYMAPESVMCINKHGKNYLKIGLKSDVWSLGCILYHLIYGKTPFHHISAVPAKVLALADQKQVIDFPDVSDPHLLDVLMKCLSREPQDRPSIKELLEHPYLMEGLSRFAHQKAGSLTISVFRKTGSNGTKTDQRCSARLPASDIFDHCFVLSASVAMASNHHNAVNIGCRRHH